MKGWEVEWVGSLQGSGGREALSCDAIRIFKRPRFAVAFAVTPCPEVGVTGVSLGYRATDPRIDFRQRKMPCRD